MHRPDASSASSDPWAQAAPGWEDARDEMWAASRAVGEGLIDLAGPRPGETVLELAAGVGDTGFLAAPLVEPEGRLITTDRSPAMLAAARRRAAELGITAAEFRELDAQALDLPDSSVDVVLCRWGFMLMDDPAAALGETRRVLRDGGRLALAVWGPRPENPWTTVLRDLLVEEGLASAEAPGQPGMFRLADRAELTALLLDAGFADVELRDLPVRWRHADADAYLDSALRVSPTARAALAELPGDRIAELRGRLAERTARYRRPDGSLELAGVSIGARAAVA